MWFEIAEAPRDGFAALACTAKLSLEDALAKVDAAKVHAKHVVDGRRKCHLRGCATLESDAAKFLRCARCKDAHYCSRACQEDDWRKMHHKRTCGGVPPRPLVDKRLLLFFGAGSAVGHTVSMTGRAPASKTVVRYASNNLSGGREAPRRRRPAPARSPRPPGRPARAGNAPASAPAPPQERRNLRGRRRVRL